MISRKVVVTAAGGPEVLEVVETLSPVPRRGEVRVAVAAAGVAFGDVMRRRGVLAPRRPFTPGYDVAGTIDAVGLEVDRSLMGRRVAVLMPRPGIGGYAEHVCVPTNRLVDIPEGVDAADAVCLGLNYITAYQLLRRVREGDRVLIHGAAGGVGSALTDLGRLRKLTMFGTASAGKHDFLRARGATPIDYRSEDFVARIAELTGDGVDVVFDPIGGAHLRRSYRALRRGGTLVSFGVSGDLSLVSALASFASLKLRPDRRHVRIYAITVTPGSGWRHCRDDWAALLAMRGKLDPRIGTRLPLGEVRQAHALMDSAAVTGKIVLTCP